jgi:hypothetical protein
VCNNRTVEHQVTDPNILLAILEARFTPKILDTCDEIRQTNTDKPWQNDIIVGLARRCYNLQKHLRRGYAESDEHYMAWAARTLLELKVWTEYVTVSEDNLRRFFQDMYVDARTAFQVGAKATAGLDDHPLKAASQKILDNAKPDLGAKLEGAEVSESERYLRLSDVAKELALEIEFSIANMTFSKWAHATAQSVLLPVYAEGKPDSKDRLFLMMGAGNAVLVIEKLSDYLKKRDLPTFEVQ